MLKLCHSAAKLLGQSSTTWYAKKNLSTKKEKKSQMPRLFKAHENKSRQRCFKEETHEREKAFNSLVMLAKQFRLTKNKDFERVAKMGRAVYGKTIALKWIKNNLPQSRFGIVVSLKIDKRATVRNKIKRRIRAIIRENLQNIKIGYDYLILTKPEIKTLTYQNLEEKLMQLLKNV